MNRFSIFSIVRFVTLSTLVCYGAKVRADFSGTPMTFKVDGGWCWFQDPRAVITNGHLIFGTDAGTTVSGASTAGDEDVVDYNLTTSATSVFVLKAAYDQDDHASPALAILPDGRLLITYESHGGNNYCYWRVSTNSGDGTAWGAEQQTTVNVTADGNGNTYNNPYYLSICSQVIDFSRAIGYDTNYWRVSGVSGTNNSGLTVSNSSYGGHFLYWKNPNNTPPLTGGNGRPYVKYASNHVDKIWFACTEDSPQNYPNSLYVGYVQFNASGVGTAYKSDGTLVGLASTGTAPAGNTSNPPVSGGNSGPIASGSGFSYLPTTFTQIVKENANLNLDLSSSSPYGAGYTPWASSMALDANGNPYIGIAGMRNISNTYASDMEYDYAHLVNGTWQVHRIAYAGYPMVSDGSQDQYAGLIAVDPVDVNRCYISTDVNPLTGAALLGPDGNQHWQIFAGVTSDGGTTWTWTQITNTPSNNYRPIVAAGSGQEALLWLQGTYTGYTNYNTNVLGLIQPLPVPVLTSGTGAINKFVGAPFSYQIAATNTPTSYTASPLPAGLTFNSSTGLMSGTLSSSGTTGITISAINLSGTATAVVPVIAQQESFELWQSQNFSQSQLNDPTVSSGTASPEGDGVSNLEKYGFNIAPWVNGAAATPVQSSISTGGTNYLTLTFIENIYATDVTFTPQVSSDLKAWNSGSGYIGPVTTATNSDGVTETVTVQDLLPMGQSPQFLRLNISQP